jgi:hypothetical protein
VPRLSLTLAGLTLLALVATASAPRAAEKAPEFKSIESPKWVSDFSRMVYITPGELDDAVKMGAQVVQFNMVWPYYPLKKDGGSGLIPSEDKSLREFSQKCHAKGMKVVLGLPPFPSVANIKAHPDWRIHPDDTGSVLKLEPKEDNLGTRIPCNQGPWGDYLIEICAELMRDYQLDGYSFDGNYHSGICFCPACKANYKRDTGRDLPKRINLDEIPYREYLVWRGERLEDHYRKLQARLKGMNPDAVVMTWTVNAGRYGQLLFSPRAMPTRMNLLLDAPMQEWWLDETNFGGSVAPVFGAAYVTAVTGGRPACSEPYLMSRGNPYGTHSFPKHERLCRVLLAVTNGALAPEAIGWPGHRESTADVFKAEQVREPWTLHAKRQPWAAMLVSEQTRQFYAYKDIAERFLPHVYGGFRVGMEEHLPLNLINDWDLNAKELAKYRVVMLPNSAALSDNQVTALREYVRNGGGLVATCETSMFDELGRPRPDFALADVFGVNYKGRPKAPNVRPELDANFAITVDENYWKQRVGVGTLVWKPEGLFADDKLKDLVPTNNVLFRGPQVLISEPKEPADSVARLVPEGEASNGSSGIIVRRFGKGRVVYSAAGVDAAMWSYSFPYQRRLLARMLEWAADKPFPIQVQAPMCVQANFFEQDDKKGRRTIVHLYNGINSSGGHGLPAQEVPLREEAVPIGGIRVRFAEKYKAFHVEPGNLKPKVTLDKGVTVVEIPPLEIHSMLVAER